MSLDRRALDGLSMMGVMGQSMATADLVEGRIVFLRTELRTIEPQASAGNAFADALLASVHELGNPALMIRQFDLQERWHLARPEGAPTVEPVFNSSHLRAIAE